MKLAKINTDQNLETCGVLAGSLVRACALKLPVIPKLCSDSLF